MTWKHGASGYSNYRCRCDTCKAGWAVFQVAYRQRRKARRGERIVRGRFVPLRFDSHPRSRNPGSNKDQGDNAGRHDKDPT